MTRQNRWLVATGMAMVFIATTGFRAGQAPPPPPRVPARVDVVVSRYQGDKKTSSLPFVLLVNTNANSTSLRVGVDVPVGTTTTTTLPEGGRAGVTTTAPSYQKIGTSVDCRASSNGDGRYDVYVSVNDSAIFGADAETRTVPRNVDPSAFRTFTTSNTLAMKDGQTMLFAAATDKISGEVLKIDVTFTLIK